jgi:DNA-binding beta-propeller fold protein YncE
LAQPRLLVLNKADNTMVAVDPIAMKVMGSVETGNGPDGLAYAR